MGHGSGDDRLATLPKEIDLVREFVACLFQRFELTSQPRHETALLLNRWEGDSNALDLGHVDRSVGRAHCQATEKVCPHRTEAVQ